MPDRDDRVRGEYDDDPPRRRRRDEDEDDRPRPPRDDRIRDDYDERAPARRRRDRDDDDDEDDYDDRPPRRRSFRAGRMSPGDLRAVALWQKVLIFAILGELVVYFLLIVVANLSPQLGVAATLGLIALYLAGALTATVFLFLLAVRLYGTGAGIALGVLALFPCIGLIVLLNINGKARGVLQEHGVRVGLLGANMGDLPRSRR